MLDLMMTRPNERPLIAEAKTLRFLVLDELHTYRGRQGADAAMLVRRVRDRVTASQVQFVGTSATLASDAAPAADPAVRVAEGASQLFGAPVQRQHFIAEALTRITREPD